MGQLLRGAVERFNPQIYTEANSLTTMMKKDFRIARKSFDLFTKYNKFQSFMYYSGRINQGIKKGKMFSVSQEINDNAYRISYQGMDILPAYSFGKTSVGVWHDASNPNPDMTALVGTAVYGGGVTATTVATDTLISFSVQHDPDNGIFGDKLNPNDKIILDNGLGLEVIVTRRGRRSSTNDHIVYDGKTIGPAGLWDAAHFTNGLVLTESGSAFGEGSLKGYQRSAKNKWRINYSFISRYTVTMTGSAKKQKVAQIYNSESKAQMWEWEELLRGERIFRMLNEQALRHTRTSMDASTHSWYENFGTNALTLNGFTAESGIEAPITGDGWIPQIEDNAVFEYNPNTGLAHTYIEAMTNILAVRSPAGSSGNTFLAVGDRVGRLAFDRGMKTLMQFDMSSATSGSSNIVYDVSAGREMTLGFEVTKYYYAGNWFIFIEDELFNHPGLYGTNGGLIGSGNVYILNVTSVEGVPNFEVFARSTRALRKKNVDGMHSFDSSADSSNQAATGFDGCQTHMLSELMSVLYDARSCGILKATAVWDGGDLAGTTIAGQKANIFTF